MTSRMADRRTRYRIPSALAGLAIIAAILGSVLPASAVTSSAAFKVLGVRKIQYGSSPAIISYLGSYSFIGPDGVSREGFCVEHSGSAPTPNSASAYTEQPNAVTSDSTMIALANQAALRKVGAFLAVLNGDIAGQQQAAMDGAAFAAAIHYRAAHLGLPGETAYPSGMPDPVGAAAFNISDDGGSTGVVNNVDVGGVSAAAVQQRAFDFYATALTHPTPWTGQATNQHADNLFNADGTAVARFRAVDANGAPARGFLNGTPTLTNGSGLQWFSDAALTTPIAYPVSLGFPGDPTEVWARWTVTDPTQGTALSTSVMTIADSISYWVPTTASEQNLVVSGGLKEVPVTSIQAPPTTPPSLTVTKTSTGGLPVGGIQFAVTNAGGLDLGTITVNADGTSNILPIHLDWLGTNVTLTEVASTAWTTGHTPAAPITVTIAEGLNTVQVANTPATTEISVTKQDADRTDQHSLAGAHVAVRKDTDANGSFETPVDEGDTLENGFLVIDGLTVGSYQVEEVTPPSGYTYGAVRTITFVVQGGAGGLEIVGLDGFEDMDGDGNADDVQFENQKPGITTQVVQDGSPAGAGPISVRNGTMVRDQATLTGVAAGTAGTIVTQAYGPFATRDEITAASCTAAKAGPSVTDTVTGPGPHVSSTLDLAAGHWVLVETWTDNTPGSTATATHVCNDTNEMIEVVPNVTVGTTATPKSQTVGGSNVDTAHVAGTNGADWEIVLKVYGPFKTVDDVNDTVCVDTNMAYTVTYTGTGDGDFPSPEFTLPSAGIYTMVESITTDDGRTATHKCGDTDETVEITPGVLTTARSGDLVVGAPQADVLSLTGVPEGEEATVVLRVYGPFASVDAVNDTVCVDDNLVWEDEFTVVGSGSHVSPEFVLDAPGVYTMVETVTYGGVTGAHACGDTHETFNVREPEETTTTTTTSTTVPDSTTTTVPATTTTTIKSSGGGGGNGGGGGLAYTGSSILYTVALAFGLTAGGLALFGVRKRRS